MEVLNDSKIKLISFLCNSYFNHKNEAGKYFDKKMIKSWIKHIKIAVSIGAQWLQKVKIYKTAQKMMHFLLFFTRKNIFIYQKKASPILQKC